MPDTPVPDAPPCGSGAATTGPPELVICSGCQPSGHRRTRRAPRVLRLGLGGDRRHRNLAHRRVVHHGSAPRPRARTGSPRSADATAATSASPAAARNTTTRPSWNGSEISCGKNCWPVSVRPGRGGSCAEHLRAEQRLDRVVAEERGEQRCPPAAARPTCWAASAGTPCALRPGAERRGSDRGQAGDHQREEHADRQHHAGVQERRPHAGGRAALGGRARCSSPTAVFGAANRPEPDPVQRDQHRELPVGEVDRQQQQPEERRRRPAAARRRRRSAAPNRSDSRPASGPATRKPTVSGSR